MADQLWIAYRDIEDHEPRGSFEILGQPTGDNALQIRDGVLPGEFGMKDIHIKWHYAAIEGTEVRLVTYTHKALPPGKVRRLLGAAYKFAQRRN